jgi:hypothetical protein
VSFKPIGGPLPVRRELGHEAHLGIGFDELIAERGKDVPVEIDAAARGIQRSRIARDADVEHTGRMGRRRNRKEKEKKEGELRAHRRFSLEPPALFRQFKGQQSSPPRFVRQARPAIARDARTDLGPLNRPLKRIILAETHIEQCAKAGAASRGTVPAAMSLRYPLAEASERAIAPRRSSG